MRLINVRRGQFVYYENKLHKVYSVKHFFKQSVHLMRLSDFEQILTTAREIDYYRPQHLDSFICNGQRYTLDRNKRAEVGDYILVTNPRPDSLDHHHLHAIEIVSSIEANGVISNKANGIKHNEYWVMVPGLPDDANVIDFQDNTKKQDKFIDKEQREILEQDKPLPKIGDVYQKNDSDPLMQTMVIAIEGQVVYLGGGISLSVSELTNSEHWTYVINVLEQ